MNSEFAADLLQGLTSKPKFLKSKYFYDERGDELFQSIMQLDEYYLTRSEFEIFSSNKEKLLNIFSADGKRFQLIEFGAGDGTKTKTLIEYFYNKKSNFKYVPIDISSNIIDELSGSLKDKFPGLEVEAINTDYFTALNNLNTSDSTSRVILFLGSNIGNFSSERSIEFLGSLRNYLTPADKVMIGFDLKKDPQVILNAYNDKSGVTRAFNLNLLERINREFHADFDISKFYHFPLYDPLTGQARSYLISKEKQVININDLNLVVSVDASEPIHMEISQKYDLEDITSLANSSGFNVINNLFDCKHYFVDSIWQPQ